MLDDLAALVAHLGDIVAACVFDRFVEGERDGALCDIKGAAGHYLVAAVDGDGDNRQAKFKSQLKGSVFEGAHEAGVRAASLGKHYNRHATVQLFLGCCHGITQSLGGVGVHQDMSCHAASSANDGNVGDALAHHPFEVMSQETVNGKDIIGSLMVSDKHVACLVVNVFAALDFDTHQM